jgi:Phosphotransferase enzyme family
MTQENLLNKAINAALTVAENSGLREIKPEVIRDRGNILVRLRPYPVVARVAARIDATRTHGSREWLTREVAVLMHLTDLNAPAVHSSPLVPPGPHQIGDLTLTFSEWVESNSSHTPNFYEIGRSLRELHGALQSYAGQELPLLAPVALLKHWLGLIADTEWLQAEDLRLLEKNYKRIGRELLQTSHPIQALHGDAHDANTIYTGRGLLWLDFEETCAGPVEWDLACLVTGLYRQDPQHPVMLQALAGYSYAAPLENILPFIRARVLQGALWAILLSEYYPDRQTYAENSLDWLRQN